MISIRIYVLLVFLHLNLLAQEGDDAVAQIPAPPKHPAIEASDSEWNLWAETNADWLAGNDNLVRRPILSEQEERLQKRSLDFDWRLEARFRGLTLNQIHSLGVGGVVATGRKFVSSEELRKPVDGVFVTSDMILHAYNMMVADLTRGIEMERAPRLRRSLEQVWDRMPYWPGLRGPHPELARAALSHAERVIGTALLCLGSPVKFRDAEVERDCRTQMQLIATASANELPVWLSPRDDDLVSIDYTKMKPVGIYTENETLRDLFRSVRWLQAVQFRPQRDCELVAFAILAEQAESSGLVRDEYVQRQWLGLPNCLTLSEIARLSEQTVSALQSSSLTVNLDDVRAILAKQYPPIHANEDMRRDPKESENFAPPPLLKILPAFLTADALLFSEIITSNSSGNLPEGRMLTAFLGDAFAPTELQQEGWDPQILRTIEQASSRQNAAWKSRTEGIASQNPYDDKGTFNSLLLHSLEALFLPPAEGAPEFMNSAAWRAKTRNTVLSAWAEKKHTWVLHEVEPASYIAGGLPPPPPPGLIEPNPEFFRRMAALAEKNFEWLEQNHFLPSDNLSYADQLKVAGNLKAARMIHQMGLDVTGNLDGKVSYDSFLSKYSGDGILPSLFPEEEKWDKLSAADFEKLRESTLLSAEAILQGLDPATKSDYVSHPPSYRRQRWTKFLKCVHQLEKMSEKQLRSEEWNMEECEYLTLGIWNDYYEVAYLGDSGQLPDPRSLGPKIAPVAFDPNTGLVLQVATGDQSEIYVLYPWKGTSYLYRGLIIPYYEMPSKTRLNDLEWQTMLKSENPPVQPRWLGPLRP